MKSPAKHRGPIGEQSMSGVAEIIAINSEETPRYRSAAPAELTVRSFDEKGMSP